MSGITIVDVKVVGACRKHDYNKEFYHHKEEDIYCMECSFKVLNDSKE